MSNPAITSSMLGVLATLTVGAGVSITNDDDLYDLGRMFYDYVEKQNELTWVGVQALFASTTSLQANKLVSVDSQFLDIVKDFLDKTFDKPFDVILVGIVPAIYNNDLRPEKALHIPSNLKENLGTTIPLGFTYTVNGEQKEAYCCFNEASYGNINFIFGYYNNNELYAYGSYTIKPTEEMYIAFDYPVNYLYVYPDQSYAKSWKINGVNATDVYDFPYTGGYDWGGVDDKIDEDGDVVINVPGDIGGLVGGLPNVWDGDITMPGDGVITIPSVDNPSIDIVDDIIVPDVPIDTPTIPNAPVILPTIPNGGDIAEGEDGEQTEEDKDKLTSTINSVAGGLYYYYIGTDISDKSIDDIIGHATGVVSLSYTPYTYYNDLNITKIPYDKERFNNLMNINSNFYVYRINDVTKPVKKVGGFKAFANDFSVNIGEGKPYNYMNETKLYQYPFSFAYLYDGINNPLEIKYHYLRYYYNDVYIKQTVSDKCTYGIFVKEYKGDNEGNLESMILTSGNELPCSSSTYAQWFATNRNQLAQNIQNIQNTNAIQNHGNIQQNEINKDINTVNGIGQLIGALGSVFSLDFGNAVGNVSSSINTLNTMRLQQAHLNTSLALNKQSEQNAIQSALALNNDMRNSPATLISHGSNVFYGLVNNNKNLLLIRMGLNEEDYFRIGTYFTMYGYKQNKVLDINLRSRRYFNYFKIVSPNIISKNIPPTHLEKIKDIFKNGITLWHYNNSNKVLDYFHADNYEV